MIFKDFIEKLNSLAEQNPEILDMVVRLGIDHINRVEYTRSGEECPLWISRWSPGSVRIIGHGE